MTTDIFEALRVGASFDRKKFAGDIALFEAPKARAALHGAEAQAGVTQAPMSKKTHKKRNRVVAGGAEQMEGGVSVFGSSAASPGPARDGNGAAVPADDSALVLTRDPLEEANVQRKQHRIRVTGADVPEPLKSFQELFSKYKCGKRVAANLAEAGYREPTPIQRQAIPALLARRELLAVAPTGSGKTLAFLLPIVVALRQERGAAGPAGGVRAVVVSPTHELGAQTMRHLAALLRGTALTARNLTKATAAGSDFSKVDILVANPLRAGALVEAGRLALAAVHFLVLDEADKLFDMGFIQQIDAVIAACTNPAVVRALFSATLPEGVEALARTVLAQPLRVTVGERNTAAASVAQRLLFVGREGGKLLALRQLLRQGLKPPVLVFVASKDRAKDLHRELKCDGVRADSIHADQSQAARQAAVDAFRAGATWLLVATDLLGRGMDFIGVNTVINYDLPQSTTDYIHRIGRTGRAGRTGAAVTFYTEDDAGQLRAIANVMRAAGCEVPAWMLALKKDRNCNEKRKAATPSHITTVSKYDRKKSQHKKQMVDESKKKQKQG